MYRTQDRSIRAASDKGILMSYQRRMEELTKPQSLELMKTVQVGRLVFVHNALPAVRPVNHLVENDTIIIRVTMGAAITKDVAVGYRGMTVAYEADAIDTARQLGWSVIAVGTAQLITDRLEAERYRSLIEPWVAGPADEVISISADMVRGYRMVPGELFGEINTAPVTSTRSS
jgi:nitroimidazol reductase NimA-like FMN-containing flavoprotein (pyridoxamine 5'-phosphate oxidase superfamily)